MGSVTVAGGSSGSRWSAASVPGGSVVGISASAAATIPKRGSLSWTPAMKPPPANVPASVARFISRLVSTIWP